MIKTIQREIFIIRWDKPVLFPDGTKAHMVVKAGTRKEAEEYAREIAQKFKVKVESVT